MNLKPLPTPDVLVARITTSPGIRWSDHQTTLLRTLLRFDNWTRPQYSDVAPIDVLRVFFDSLKPNQRLHHDVRRIIRRLLRCATDPPARTPPRRSVPFPRRLRRENPGESCRARIWSA